MRKEVKVVFLINPVTAPGALGGEVSLSSDKQTGIEMYTGDEPGFLTIYYRGKKIGTPITNCRTIIWEKESK